MKLIDLGKNKAETLESFGFNKHEEGTYTKKVFIKELDQMCNVYIHVMSYKKGVQYSLDEQVNFLTFLSWESLVSHLAENYKKN